MARKTSIDIDTRVLDGIIKNLGGNVAAAIETVVFSIEGRAKTKAPVDMGALSASIYSAINGKSADVKQYADVTYLTLPRPENNATAYVGPSVEYGEGVELGTRQRAATPYLLPAVRETEGEFRQMLRGAITNK